MLNSGIRFKRVPRQLGHQQLKLTTGLSVKVSTAWMGIGLALLKAGTSLNNPVQWLLDDAHGIGVIGEREGYLERQPTDCQTSPLEKLVPVGRRLLAIEMTSRDSPILSRIYLFDCDATDAGDDTASIEIVRGREGQLRRDALNERIVG